MDEESPLLEDVVYLPAFHYGGGAVLDRGYLRLDGTRNGNASFASTPYGTGLDFDGTGDFVSLPDNAIWDFTGASDKWTWCFVLRPDSFTEWGCLYATETGGVFTAILAYIHTSTASNWTVTEGILWGIVTGNGAQFINTPSTNNALVAGQWHRVVVTYDGALSAASRTKIYVDGIDRTGTASTTGTLGNISPTSIRYGQSSVAGEDLDYQLANMMVVKGQVWSPEKVGQWTSNPWQVWRPRRTRVAFFIGSGDQSVPPAIASAVAPNPTGQVIVKPDAAAGSAVALDHNIMVEGPPVHRASAAFSTTNPTTSATVVLDSGIQEGDDLYVAFTSRDHTAGTALATCTDDDSGGNTWTRIGGSTDRKANVFWKKATSGTAGKTVTVAGAVGSLAGGYSAYSGGLATGDPTTDLAFETNASADETHAGFTPSFGNSMVFFAVFNYANDNAVTVLAAATLGTFEPERFEKLSMGGSDCACILASKASPGSPAGTGNFTWSQTNGTTYSAVWAMRPKATTTSPVANAPATGTAPDPTGRVVATPGAAAATATALDADFAGPETVEPSSAVATATAPTPTGQVRAIDLLSTAIATAPDPAARIQAISAAAAAVATGADPLVAVRAALEVAASSAVAPDPTTRVIASPAAGTGSAVASDPTGRVVVKPDGAAASGVANDPTIGGTQVAEAGAAAATATVSDPSARVVAKPDAASGTATASDPSARLTASPGAAPGSGTAPAPTVRVTGLPAAAAALATANDVLARIIAKADPAAAAGTVPDPTARIRVPPAAGAATGTAPDPKGIVIVRPDPGVGNAVALNPSAGSQDVASPNAAAGNAVVPNAIGIIFVLPGSAVAQAIAADPTGRVVISPASAAASATANAPSSPIRVTPVSASSSAVANDPHGVLFVLIAQAAAAAAAANIPTTIPSAIVFVPGNENVWHSPGRVKSWKASERVRSWLSPPRDPTWRGGG